MAIDIDLDDVGYDVPVPEPASEQPVSPTDALIHCVRDLHRVDLSYMTALSGLAEDEVVSALDGAIFLDPETDEWQMAATYLSGDLGQKLKVATEACAGNEFFKRNVAALKDAMPPRVPASEIYATLGSPWIPTDIILDFIHHLLPAANHLPFKVTHDKNTGSWTIQNKSYVKSWPGSVAIWGTKRVPALNILDDSLNGRDVRVYDEIECDGNRSGVKRVLNYTDTMEALEKQRRMIQEFGMWLWSDHERSRRLEDYFNMRYCTFAPQRFDGSRLEFPGMSPEVQLRPYQRDAVMRMLLSKNVLLAHDVGAGKTYTCIAAGMEYVRIDPTEKVLYVVPNNVLSQWADLFAEMYPQADVLVVYPSTFTKARRQSVLAKIRDGKYDAIIMAHSSFDLIPLSKSFKKTMINTRIAELNEALANPQRATTAVKVARNHWRRRREKLYDEADKDLGICFDELHVTRLFVDEAHNYKNLSTEMNSEVLGMSPKGSQKCDHMLDAVRHTMRTGGGVVFATGTVLTNSIADCYTFQRYLQPATLSNLDIADFDAWSAMFAQKRTSWEIDVDTSTYRLTTRFGGFGNLDVLSSVLGYIADFHHMEPGDDLPACKGRLDILVPKTDELTRYLSGISKRTDLVRRGRVQRKKDNLLKICTDGHKAGLDIRLVDGTAKPGWLCKVGMCASNIYRYWLDTSEERLTQLVFCDISTPCDGFNVYDELKQTLIVLGVPKDEIAFVHDADSEYARSRLFKAMREGTIRVLIGSTPKLGLGVNVQDRLIALHHLDVPWRPADMTQREGRILRQGNTNPEVYIFRYVTEGSFDAYSWQLLERKQRAIDELLAGTYASGWLDSDVGVSALSYGEIKALAVGNPKLRERVELSNELERTLILQRKNAAGRARLFEKSAEIMQSVKAVETALANCAEDSKYAASLPTLNLSVEERAARGAIILRHVDNNAFGSRERIVGSYRGFFLVVPAGMDPEHPMLFLSHKGRWPVDLTDAKERGVLTRLDNAIKGLPKRCNDLIAQREMLYENWRQAKRELKEGTNDLTYRIEHLRSELARIDIALEKEALGEAV